MTEELRDVVREWQSKGASIADEEVEYLLCYCKRKMEVCKIANQEEYLPLLFADEVKNFLLRNSINATTMLRKLEEEELCAVCV